ncbi:hypothetical protein ACH5RR_003125 [Cinchona calisaya]|uniref:F-box domain-containing protein n=1 Tax=Cinchona calisaya TaxID=153742 RepID=A0ABD3AUH9_9GENT
MAVIPWFLGELSRVLISWFSRSKTIRGFFHVAPILVKKNGNGKTENLLVETDEYSLLDLPDLALDCILERLSTSELCSMAAVCRSLREKCRSDHLWEKHMKQKWGRLIGNIAAYQQGQRFIALRNRAKLLKSKKKKGLFRYSSIFWTKIWNRSKENEIGSDQRNLFPVYSIMSWYLAIESGKFWFPAQVYNREVQNGQLGFMLSCYDAELSYDSSTDTFTARYSAHGRRTIEDKIEWNRIRAPAVDTPAHVLHVSDCLHELKPGDHIEVQWRRNKDFPYGWWYGVVGHFESCTGHESQCQCHLNDTVVLEFKQYTLGSRWRRTIINRKEHREVGNGADGFYGGIRKLCDPNEILMWKCLWPKTTLE